MGVQSLSGHEHMGHLLGDVPALVLVAVVLSVLVVSPDRKVSGLSQATGQREMR
jgi:hypothetical protein